MSIQDSLRQKIDAHALALFRILFFAILFWELLRKINQNIFYAKYIWPKVLFPYEFFSFLPRPSEQFLVLMLVLWGGSALCGLLGICFRWSAIVGFLSYTYIFLLDQSYYNNHYYLISLFLFLFCWVDADAKYSLSNHLRKRKPRKIASWQLELFKWQMLIVFFYGGMAKLNTDWIQGYPLSLWMSEMLSRAGLDSIVVGRFIDLHALAIIMSWAGLVINFFVEPALLFKRWKIWAALILICFHLANWKLFQIGVFPFLGIGSLVLFFNRDNRNYNLLPNRFPVKVKLVGAVLASFVVFQLIFPLRHWLYEGHVNWTTEGYPFSWRMKLDNRNSVRYQVVARDVQRDTYEVLPLFPFVNRAQRIFLSTSPIQNRRLASFLSNMLSYENEIRFVMKISHNGRKPREIINSSIDLAREPVKLLSSYDWVLK